jgi:hypothetical protein
MELQLGLPADGDGFVAFECPHSGDRFKVHGSEYETRSPSALYCPVCGLSDEPGQFLTDDSKRAARDMVANAARDLMARELRSLSRSTRGAFRVRANGSFRHEPVQELHEVTDLVIAELRCCGARVKVNSTSSVGVLYCPYCGSLND